MADPQPPTDEPRPVPSVTGMLFGWDAAEQTPMYMQLPGSPFAYIACFSSEAQLQAFHQETGIPLDGIKQINDGNEFLASFAATPDVHVIIDPHFRPDGQVQYLEVVQS